MTKSVNFAILGSQGIASELGKKGTSTDLTLYDKKTSWAIRTCVAPTGYPEKIQSLFQALGMSEHVIFHVDTLDRFTGEQIIALDALKITSGILSHTFEVDESRLESMIRGTVVEKYARAEPNGLKEAVCKFEQTLSSESDDTASTTMIAIDHSFDVKGVGTVVLGRVVSGKINQYDCLTLYPAGIQVVIKSIQMHDEPVKEAGYNARVGLSLKGARPEDIARGDLLSTGDNIRTQSHITINFKKNLFYFSKNGDLVENQGCVVSTGLHTGGARITSVGGGGRDGTLELEFERPAAYMSGDTAVILRPEATPIRIVGHGQIQ